MPQLFRDQAVALLARERLHEIRDQLRAKKAADPARFTAIEARVLWLAEQAAAATNGAPPIPLEHFPRVFHVAPGETASKFFTMGALGTSIPGFGSLPAADQDWVQRVLRKGTRDERRERVDAGSARLALEVWRRSRSLINSSTTMSPGDKTAALAAARAFYLGHLCHIASNVVGSPVLDEMTWHLPGPSLAGAPAGITLGTDVKLSRDDVEREIEQLIKTQLFQPSVGGATDYAAWLPTGVEVPPPIFQAFAEATRDLYLGGTGHRGLADLEAAFSAGAPQVSKEWLTDAYASLRNSIAGVLGGTAPTSTDREWGFWSWVAVLTPIVVPSLLTVPLIAKLDKGQNIGGTDAQRGDEKAWWQVFALQYAGTGLILPLYVVIASAVSVRGFSQESWIAIVLGLIVLGFSIALLARLDHEDDDDPGARWTLLAIPAVLELLYAFIYIAAIRGGGNRYNRLFAAIFVLHVAITCLNVAYLAIKDVSNGLKGDAGTAFGYWALYGFLLAPLVLLGLPSLILLATNPPEPPAPTPPGAPPPITPHPFVAAPRYARLFDDSTLVTDPDLINPALAQHFYPAGDADAAARRRRKLMTLRLQGATADLYVRSRGDRLELKWVGPPTGGAAPTAATAPDQTIELPQAPMRVRVFAGMLGLVRQPAGGPGVLTVTVDVPEAEDHLLPEGLVLAVGFEDDLTRADAARRTAGDTWQQVVAAGLPIHHATKSRLSVMFGKRGDATAADEPAGTASNATGTIAQGATSDSVVGTGTQLVKEIAAGDRIQVGGNQAVVDEVIDDSHLRLSAPATWLPAAAAPAAFQRVSDDRRYDAAGAGNLRTHQAVPAGPPAFTVSAPPIAVGAGTQFDRFLMTGDVIRVITASGNQERRIVRVRSATVIEIDAPFSTAIDAGGGSPYVRVGRHAIEGMPFFASAATDLQSGASALDQAADLAALLCLGGVSHVMTDAERQPTAGTATRFPGPPIARVYQCFRNWNLDRRRVNEWKMLVAGGAVSEKGGRPITQPESTMIPPAVEDGWNPVNTAGEAVANQLGWVELLRRWVDVARRAGSDVLADAPLRPGDPSNVLLSRGLAYLLDLPDPRPAGP